VGEAVVVLQARAEEPVQADVGEPDQGQGHDDAVGLPVAGAEHDGRQGRGVRQVVQVRAGTGPSQVAAHGDVGGEDRGRPLPTVDLQTCALPQSRVRAGLPPCSADASYSALVVRRHSLDGFGAQRNRAWPGELGSPEPIDSGLQVRP